MNTILSTIAASLFLVVGCAVPTQEDSGAVGDALRTETNNARRGDDRVGGDRRVDGDRRISCVNVATSAALLSFQGFQGAGAFANEVFSLDVTSRGDDIASIRLVDKRSGDTLVASRQAEVLTVSLATDESPSTPMTAVAATRRGLAEASVSDPQTGDSATVRSYSRRGTGEMTLKLVTDEEPTTALEVRCTKQ